MRSRTREARPSRQTYLIMDDHDHDDDDDGKVDDNDDQEDSENNSKGDNVFGYIYIVI